MFFIAFLLCILYNKYEFYKGNDEKLKNYNTGKDKPNKPIAGGNSRKAPSSKVGNHPVRSTTNSIKNTKNATVAKLKNNEPPNKTVTKKLGIAMLIVFILLFFLVSRLFWIEIVQGAELKEMAYKQQTINRIISPARGTIYDSTGKALAISSRVDTVTINPGEIKYSNDKRVEPEVVSRALADIFELDYQEVYDKVTSNSSVQTIIRKVNQDKITALKTWMSENKVTAGINIDEDSKRSYPYATFASHLIGFCGTDNNGLSGLESTWNDVLTGTPGKIVTSTDSAGQEILDDDKRYIAAENGSDIVLSIDYYLQLIVEKYLKQAVIENGCLGGGTAIMMDPETGDILAMANYPDYDLNNAYTPNESLANGWDELSSEEKMNNLYEMWRNKAASATYEPGSTFKLITSAIALEEGIVGTDDPDEFYCNSYYVVDGQRINCWRDYYPLHESQSLRKALQNSCNPAFMQLGERIGVTRFYKYMRAFGLFERTGADLYGEANSIMHDEDSIIPVELATLSFGQRFNITPLQLVTAVSAIVNDGILMKPRIVKQIINSDTNAVTNIEPEEVRQVISKETSEIMRDMMRSVVTDGTGQYVNIEGYSIGGKSGTSEPIPGREEEDGYISSFIAIAPTTDVKVVTLVALYHPTAGKYQGGETAGPVVKQILSEALPYLGITSDSESSAEEESTSLITLNDVRNKTVAEAEKLLRDAGFQVESSISENKTTTLVSDQVPKPGVKLSKDSYVFLYTEDQNVHLSVSVPNLKGMSAQQATNSLRSKKLNINVQGTGKVVSQDYTVDTQVEEGTIVTVTLEPEISGAY